jgi:glycosyltransferase involved in cell wall biosynthesis
MSLKATGTTLSPSARGAYSFTWQATLVKKILFVQHSVSPPGGGPGVGAFMLDVLKDYGQIDLLTLVDFKPEQIDEYYGTSLSQGDIRPIMVSSPFLKWTDRLDIPSGLMKLHVLMRASKKHLANHDDYDMVCSGYDEHDLGRPCIQYIHYPWNLYPRPDAPPGWNENPILRNVILLYNFLCRHFSRFSYEAIYQNLTLVNSNWTGQRTRERYPKLDYLVVNPPALAELIEYDGTPRQEKFLSIGRCAPEKEWLKLIDIVAALRERGHDVGLTLAGSRNTHWYEEQILQRQAEVGDWLTLELDFSRERLQELLRSHRYGLHGMKQEHYGMAVAELVLGGCLTSVHDDGGQVEIVTNPKLRYGSAEDAVEKWDEVLSSESLKRELLEEQLAHREHLPKERFLEELDQVVQLCFERGVEGVVHGLREGSLETPGQFSRHS